MKTTTNMFAAQLLGFIAGINKRLAGKTLLLDDQEFTDKQLVALFQPCVDTANVAKQAEIDRSVAVAKAAAARTAAKPIAKALKAAVLAMFGGNTAALADFQLKPKKPTPPTPQVKAAAAVKAKATRKALGTKGTLQRKNAKKALAQAAAPPAPGNAPGPEPAAPPATPALPVAPATPPKA